MRDLFSCFGWIRSLQTIQGNVLVITGLKVPIVVTWAVTP
jgi:hypothetical protein